MYRRREKTGKTPKRPSASTIAPRNLKKLDKPLFKKVKKKTTTTSSQPNPSQSSDPLSDSQAQSQLLKRGQTIFSDDEDSKGKSKSKEKKSKKSKKSSKTSISKVGITKSSKTKKTISSSPRKVASREIIDGLVDQAKRRKKSDINSEDEENESIDEDDNDILDSVGDMNETSKDGLRTFHQAIPLSTVQKTWANLPPNIVAILDVILDLFIDESLSMVKFRSEKHRHEFREFIKSEMVDPLVRRFGKMKLPLGITENQLNQEYLFEENSRLDSNLDANLKQLATLDLEVEKQKLYLKQEKEYLKQYSSKVGASTTKMQKDLIALEKLIGDPELYETANEQNGRLNDGFKEPLTEEGMPNDDDDDEDYGTTEDGDVLYDPREDKELMDVLGILSKHLTTVEKNIDPVKPVAHSLEKLGNLLSLLQ
ncbi:unnamed protein product [Ambrosiozyma monospora]|uniref:Unnamed protein product n=1 Tax=Ambrosiozyma monospora TaxID=43982 RepID=A0A9W6Z3D2_AMBMO|nr:unnamed protein product [Ambrosiozyma monospora]